MGKLLNFNLGKKKQDPEVCGICLKRFTEQRFTLEVKSGYSLEVCHPCAIEARRPAEDIRRDLEELQKK